MSRREGERGQAAVELALALPLLAVLALACLQAALVVRDQLALTAAAREAAREVAVAGDPGAGERGALAGVRLDPERLQVTVTGRAGPGSRATVTLVYRAPTAVPVVGALLDDVTLRAVATVRVEGWTERVTNS